MAKKLGELKSTNLKGIQGLIANKETAEKPKEKQATTTLTKTFNIDKDYFEFLEKYARYRSFKDNKRFTQKEVLQEALELLKGKYKQVLDLE